MNTLFVNKTLSCLHCFRRTVFQDFQLIFGLAYQSAQRHGNGQSNHSRTRNAYAHRILQDIGT
jgi:hypothetical protein